MSGHGGREDGDGRGLPGLPHVHFVDVMPSAGTAPDSPASFDVASAIGLRVAVPGGFDAGELTDTAM